MNTNINNDCGIQQSSVIVLNMSNNDNKTAGSVLVGNLRDLSDGGEVLGADERRGAPRFRGERDAAECGGNRELGNGVRRTFATSLIDSGSFLLRHGL